jgi:hypothetical protein
MEDQPGAQEVRRVLRRARRRLGSASTLSDSHARGWFAAAVLLGAAVRIASLPLPGTHDVAVWKIWSYAASHEDVGRLYGVGGSPPERRLVSFRGAETIVDYPPIALFELGAAGRVYGWATRGQYPDSTALIVTLKATAVLADAGFALLLYAGLGRIAGPRAARWATTVYWLNPAVVLDASMLGYLDPLFVLPVGGSLLAAVLGSPGVAGALGAVAVLTKPQAVVVGPAMALAVWNAKSARPPAARLTTAAGGAIAIAALAVGPVIAAGGWPNMVTAFERLGHHDMLSGNACNLWWIVGYVMRAYYSMHDMGIWAAFTTPTRILQISRVVQLGYSSPRPIGTALALTAMAWGLWTARRAGDLWLFSALSAFLVHAYATLSAQVHENHLFAAVPLLVIAAAGRRRFVPVLWVLSAIVALNLNMFYGISEDIGYAIPRTLTVIDLSVIVAVANCAALGWHATVLRSECSRVDAPRLSTVPA